MRVGKRAAVKALAGVHLSFFPLIAFIAGYPGRARAWVKSSQGWRWKKTGGIELPFVSVISGELSAVRTLPPTETAMRKQELRQPNREARFLEFVEPLCGSLVERIPRPIIVRAAYPAGGN